MRKNRKPDGLGAHAAFVVVMILLSAFSLFSCSSCDDPYVEPPAPPVKPVVVLRPAANVGINSATLAVSVIPNEKDTYISFEYKQTAATDWQVVLLPSTYSGKDSVKLTENLSGLIANTEYSFRVKASNEAGEVTSDIKKLCTYAVADYDGNLYHTVTIGTQTFLKENLKATHYANGDPISHITDPNAWETLTVGSYCYYNNDSKIGEIYGALYNHYAAADSRGFIAGWHTPTIYEFVTLENFLGGYYPAGPALMETGTAHWINPSRPGTNSTGFTALPNGALAPETATLKFIFMALGEDAIFWSSSSEGSLYAYPLDIDRKNCWTTIGYYYPKTLGFGIRLLKN